MNNASWIRMPGKPPDEGEPGKIQRRKRGDSPENQAIASLMFPADLSLGDHLVYPRVHRIDGGVLQVFIAITVDGRQIYGFYQVFPVDSQVRR